MRIKDRLRAWWKRHIADMDPWDDESHAETRYVEKPLPCGQAPGDCSAAGLGCEGCGNNPKIEEVEP
jgi:hypothetical protein